jgi:hypothetical protein
VLYVVFMGTKHVRDWLTDANVRQVPLSPPGDGAAVHKVRPCLSVLCSRAYAPAIPRLRRLEPSAFQNCAADGDAQRCATSLATAQVPRDVLHALLQHPALQRRRLAWELISERGWVGGRRGQGFQLRAAQIPVYQMWQRARRHGRILYLCGHSLGGAVAALTTLSLLHQLDCPAFSHGANPLPPIHATPTT